MKVSVPQFTPLCPAGHLPHKGGERPEAANLSSLIPVLVTGIQQRHVRAAHDQGTQRTRFEMKSVPTGLQTQAGWIPVTSTGMRALAASAMAECKAA